MMIKGTNCGGGQGTRRLRMMVFVTLLLLMTAFSGGTDEVCAQDTAAKEPLVDILAENAGRIKPSAQKAAAASIAAARAAAKKRAWQNGYELLQSLPPGPGDQPDYYTVPNWANTPPIRKFVDSLPPMGCTAPSVANNLGQCIPVAVPDTTTYPGADYYEIELGQYAEQMNSDLNPTTQRGYRQTNTAGPASQFHHLGPIIIAQRGRPVRIKFTNNLPTGPAGDLFVPVDTTVMGAGDFDINFDPETKDPISERTGTFTQNRGTLHLHGGRTPWISDGTPQQWIAPAGDSPDYPKGVSVEYVPDMWFDSVTHATITACAEQTFCGASNATNNPGPGAMTFYWTNQQSARLMFYHDHAWGTTRQDVYVGEAAGYLIQDAMELALMDGGTVRGRTYAAGTIPADQIPLILEDKTFVDADPDSPTYVRKTDPTWAWGSGSPDANGIPAPVTGDLWWPHVYMPAQNPYAPDGSGINAMGRWHYGPWFYPPTPVCGSSPQAVAPFCVKYGTAPNLYYDPTCDPAVAGFCQPPEIPGTPDVSWGAEAFLDTPTVNGTAYPYLEVDPKAYRFRILNASHDRFFDLQFYKPSPIVSGVTVTNGGSGYAEPPAVVISGGGGTGASATATVADGVVTAITVTSSGSGYTGYANVLIAGDGLGATAAATISGGAVTGVTVTNGGSGYTTAVVAINGNGTGAAATATINSGVVTAITLDTVGSGYASVPSVTVAPPAGEGETAAATAAIYSDPTEVGMVPAVLTAGFPTNWPTDSREGGVPDPATSGPAWIQIGTDSGFLPAPVLLKNHPIMWNLDVTMFNFGNVLPLAEGGGTLILGPAERADVIVDFSRYAGQTLILYNDAPTAYPALDPHYDYYTGAPDRTDIGGAPAIPPGVAPNVRTVMQIRVRAGADSSAPANDYDPSVLANLQNAFNSTTGQQNGTPGVFEADQDPIIAGQAAYDSAYNMTFPTAWPNWGIARISDYSLSFMKTDGTLVSNFAMEPKAIHDEMGAAFDEYGRMSAKLGLSVQFANTATATFALQNYVDPSTEIIPEGATQIWRITHNGVDTHPVHFHLFDVQLINRVGWDGFIRLPDANERGWKDTIRTSPLEDTIVALRPIKPDVPFTVPDSYRPLNPEAPVNVGNQDGFSQVDPTTAGPLAVPQTNVMVNFGWEYVWHCHILSHEENDMMRPIIFDVPSATPAAPTSLTASTVAAPAGGIGQQVKLDWTRGIPATPNKNIEIGFHIERCEGSGCNAFTRLVELPSIAATTYTDALVASGTTYSYRVKAYNALGDGTASNTASATPSWPTAAGVTLTDNPVSPSQVGGAVLFTAQCLDSGNTPIPCLYRFSRDGNIVKDYGALGVPNSWIMSAATPPGTYAIRVDVTTDPVSLASLANATINHQLSGGVRLWHLNNPVAEPSVTQAFAAAVNTDVIDAWGVQFAEAPITFSPAAATAVTFRGGWDNVFTLRTGMTSLQGPLTIGGGGMLTVENLTVR